LVEAPVNSLGDRRELVAPNGDFLTASAAQQRGKRCALRTGGRVRGRHVAHHARFFVQGETEAGVVAALR